MQGRAAAPELARDLLVDIQALCLIWPGLWDVSSGLEHV
jgi:hypothetical protein